MPIHIKRLIFWSLIFLFLLDSVVVYLSGQEGAAPEADLSTSAKAGKLLFQEHNCTACHQLYGLGGYMGPDLTNVISSREKGETYAGSVIKYGTFRMPDFHLSVAEVNALVSYLKYVDKTGRSPVRNFAIHYTGTVLTETKE